MHCFIEVPPTFLLAKLLMLPPVLIPGQAQDQRIDSSGNLVNIGNLTTIGASTFTSTGANGFTFKPGTDNSTAFQIQNAAGTSNLLVADTTNTRLGVGTASPNTTLTVYNGNESVTQTDFTQALNKGGINIVTDFTDGAYTPGIFWSTQDNNSTKPKAGIYVFEDGTFGTSLLFGTSGSYTTGITNTALTLGPSGSAIFKNGSDSSTGFQVKNSFNAGLLTVNTSTNSVLVSSLFIDTLGSANTDTVLCHNSSDQVATCNSTFVTTSNLTLQNAYNTGNTILTTNARDIDFTLANNATDANFTIDIATGSTGEFQVESNGTDILQIGSAGQLQLDAQGSGGGLLIGGDASFYRSATDTLTGEIINATTGINTGAVAGTQRIDASGNLVNIGNLTGTSAVAIASGGTNQNLTLNASGNGQIRLGGTSTGDILLAGGAGTTGCSIGNSTGNLTCDGTINGATISGGNVSGGTLTASAVNSLNVSGTAISGTGALTIDANGANTVSIGATSTGNILLGGGSGSTGCTVTNSTGALACSGSITTTATSGTQGWWSRSGTTLQPANAGDNISTSGNIALGSSSDIIWNGDTNLYRNGAAALATDGWFELVGGGSVLLQGGYIEQDDASSTTAIFLDSEVLGDSVSRFRVNSDGTISWGSGSGARDTNLYRYGANVLATDDSFKVENGNGENITLENDPTGVYFNGIGDSATDWLFTGKVFADTDPRVILQQDGTIIWGDGSGAGDTALYRSGANSLETDGDFYANSEIGIADDAIFSWGYNGFSTSIQAADNGSSSYMQFQVDGNAWLAVGANGAAFFQSDAPDALDVST